MDISQLRTIISVAELGSLSRAAERLNVAQPALSRQLRMLEEELGARLFDRHGRGMVATETGEEVLRHAERVMAEIGELRAAVSSEDAPLRGHVSVGMPPTVSDLLAVPLVQAISERHPDATVRIVSAYSSFLLDWLLRGDIDLAILFDIAPSRSLASKPLLEEVLYLIGPPGSELGPDAPVDFVSLRETRLLLPSRGNGIRTIVERCASEAGILLDVRTEADSYSTLKSLVRNGHGRTILPLAPINAEIAVDGLTYAPLVNPTPHRRLMMSTFAGKFVPRLARFAMGAISDTVERMIQTDAWPGKALTEPEPSKL